MSATLNGKIDIKNGGANDVNYNTYGMLRMKDAPEVEVHLVESSESPEGLGEISLPTISAALCNAIFRATGTRVRKLPVELSQFV